MELIFLVKLQQLNRRITLYVFSFNLSRLCLCSHSTPDPNVDNSTAVPWTTLSGHRNLCLSLAWGKPRYNVSIILSILADVSAEFLRM